MIKRLSAFAIDLFIVAIYGLCLFLLVVLINGGLPVQELPYNTYKQQLIGFVSLVLPTLLYFIYSEWRFGRTFGKKLMGIRVVSIDGKNIRFGQIAIRNILKLLPWEIAHFGVHQFISANLSQNKIPMIAFASSVFAQLLILIYLGFAIWHKQSRTPYDLVARTRVIND